MTELNNISTALDIRELRDDELDHVAGGRLLDGLLSGLEADTGTAGILGNPANILGDL